MIWGIDFSLKGTEALYRERDGKLLIELELHSIMQIFNSFDPAPFTKKSLMKMQRFIFIIPSESSL